MCMCLKLNSTILPFSQEISNPFFSFSCLIGLHTSHRHHPSCLSQSRIQTSWYFVLALRIVMKAGIKITLTIKLIVYIQNVPAESCLTWNWRTKHSFLLFYSITNILFIVHASNLGSIFKYEILFISCKSCYFPSVFSFVLLCSSDSKIIESIQMPRKECSNTEFLASPPEFLTGYLEW